MSDIDLQQELVQIKEMVQHTKDYQDVQNLMSKLSYMNKAGMMEEVYGHVAKKTPGVLVEIGGRGVYEGYERAGETLIGFAKARERGHGKGMKETYSDENITSDRTGMLETQVLGTPIIEIANDGQTAKGLWTAITAQTEFSRALGKPEAFWVVMEFAVDFVKEDNEWKIWHYRLAPMIRTPYYKSWVDNSILPSGAPKPGPPPGTPAPDKPSTEFFNPYDIFAEYGYFPIPPEPYDTFEETHSY